MRFQQINIHIIHQKKKKRTSQQKAINLIKFICSKKAFHF
jgi:hypothetical protein